MGVLGSDPEAKEVQRQTVTDRTAWNSSVLSAVVLVRSGGSLLDASGWSAVRLRSITGLRTGRSHNTHGWSGFTTSWSNGEVEPPLLLCCFS